MQLIPSVSIHPESHPSRLKLVRFRTPMSTSRLAGWYVFRLHIAFFLALCAHVACVQGLPYVLSLMSRTAYTSGSFPRSFHHPDPTAARRRS